MARIRSVHPGLWTDEAFVSCSPTARLLAIGLWTEADDGGVFSWKPLGLRMRLLPGDTVDMPALLAELEAADMVRPYHVNGHSYGAIRNFCRFQRPKKPNEVHPRVEWVASYVGKSTEPEHGPGVTSSEPVPNQSATGSENGPQMEDGGCKESPTNIEVNLENRDLDQQGAVSGASAPSPADAGPSALTRRNVTALVPKDRLRQAVEAWNEVCGDLLPRVLRLTSKREAHLRLRLREECGGSLDRWRDYCVKIRGSPFLCGDNHRGWRASFDFAIGEGNMIKVLEGRYDRTRPTDPYERMYRTMTEEDARAAKLG